jgi:hypothetical protein
MQARVWMRLSIVLIARMINCWYAIVKWASLVTSFKIFIGQFPTIMASAENCEILSI